MTLDQFILLNCYHYPATVLAVIDGDTIDVEIDLGFHLRLKTRVRLLGADTYETRIEKGKPDNRELGLAGKLFTENKLLASGNRIVFVSSSSDQNGTPNKSYMDSFGRVLGSVYYFCPESGNVLNLSDQLYAAGLAVPFKKG